MNNKKDIFDEVIFERQNVAKMKNETIVVYDYGTFIYFAQALAKFFKKVYYYTPWKGSFPTAEKAMIGEGIDGIENLKPRKRKGFFDLIREKSIDLVVFPDVGDGDMAEMIRAMGIPVFSMGKSEILEMNRGFFKKKLKEVGLPTTPYDEIQGTEVLRTAFKDQKNRNRIAKLSYFRGLMETFELKNYNHVKSRMNYLAHHAGAYGSQIDIILEDKIEGVEVGTDWSITTPGWFERGMYGLEVKGSGYVSKVIDFKNMPKPLKEVHSKIGQYIAENGGMGMMSTEVIVTKDLEPYWIDATQRLGSPPGEIISANYVNLGEQVRACAHGYKVTPKEKHKYAASVVLSSRWATYESIAIDFPKEMSPYLRFRNLYMDTDGQYYFIPQQEIGTIGAAIGFSDKSIEEAEKQALEVAKTVEADSIEFEDSIFDKANEQIEKAYKIGLGSF